MSGTTYELRIGCGPYCSVRDGHDAVAHEEFGRAFGAMTCRLQPLTAGPFTILTDGTALMDGAPIDFGQQRRPWSLLRVLVAEPGRTHSWDDLAARVLGYEGDESARTNLRRIAERLRDALGDRAALVATVHGVGVRLEVPS